MCVYMCIWWRLIGQNTITIIQLPYSEGTKYEICVVVREGRSEVEKGEKVYTSVWVSEWVNGARTECRKVKGGKESVYRICASQNTFVLLLNFRTVNHDHFTKTQHYLATFSQLFLALFLYYIKGDILIHCIIGRSSSMMDIAIMLVYTNFFLHWPLCVAEHTLHGSNALKTGRLHK